MYVPALAVLFINMDFAVIRASFHHIAMGHDVVFSVVENTGQEQTQSEPQVSSNHLYPVLSETPTQQHRALNTPTHSFPLRNPADPSIFSAC